MTISEPPPGSTVSDESGHLWFCDADGDWHCSDCGPPASVWSWEEVLADASGPLRVVDG